MDPTIYVEEEAKEQLLEARTSSYIESCLLLSQIHGLKMCNSIPNKVTSLSRLMRLLVSSKFFSMKILPDGEEGFVLTLSSQLLLKDHPLSQTPFSLTTLSLLTEPSSHLTSWFQNDIESESPFQIAQGKTFWEKALHEPKFNEYFNHAMECDSRFVASLLVTNKQFKGLLDGVNSLVDVGGGNGMTAKAISEAYPSLVCTVLDQLHVVEGLQENDNSNVVYVAGDMFMNVPLADVVLLKWILHNWSDNNCIKILKQCKEAIPNKSQGDKVIIIDIVVEPKIKNSEHSNVKILFDVQMMSLFGEGKERTEEEWKIYLLKLVLVITRSFLYLV